MRYETIKGRIAVVTGGSRGIGAVIARELGRQGADVLINCNEELKTPTNFLTH